MSDAISKAIEALRMTKYCIPAYGFHAEKVTIDEAIAGLQALQSGEPVVDVNQQLVEALQAVLDCGSTSDQWWIDKAREALLSAGKGE